MNPNNLQPGQPINTEDAMNDAPENMEQDDREAYNAWAKMSQEEAAAKSDAFANEFAGETNENSKTGKERTETQFDLYPRQAGETNEEYSARLKRMNEMKAQFDAEHPVEEPAEPVDKYKEMVEKRVESGDLKREDADKYLEKRDQMVEEREQKAAEEAENQAAMDSFAEKQEAEKMDLAERIRKEVPEALEFLEKHPELKTEMAAAVKKLEELEAIANIKEDAESKIDAELAARNEKFMNAVEAFNTAAKAREEAEATLRKIEENHNPSDADHEAYNEAEKAYKEADEAMKAAEEEKKRVDAEYDEFEKATREDAEKRTEELTNNIETRDAEVDEKREAYNEDFEKAQAELQDAKAANEQARAKMAELEKRAEAGENIADAEFQAAEDEIHASEKAVADAEGKIDALKAEAAKVDSAEEAGAEAGEAEKAEAVEAAEAGEAEVETTAEKDVDPEFEKFKESYLSDPDWRAIYTRNGVFDEESCVAAIKNMYEAKKKADAEDAAKAAETKPAEVVEMAAEEEPEAEDGFETVEQRGLFAKLKNFFKGNKRSKAGAERAMKKGGLTGWRKLAYAGLLALVVGVSGANMMQGALPSKGPDVQPTVVQAAEIPTPEKVENEDTKEVDNTADLNKAAEDISLKVDLNAEKGEDLSNLVDTTSYGENIEVNISYGDFDGTTEFLDYSEKHGNHNLTKELYDMDNESLTDVQKAEQIAEGLANVLDDPIEQGQFAGLGGADVVIDGKVNGIVGLESMDEVLDRSMQDDELRMALADYNKEMYRNLVDNYDLQVEHRDKGSLHYSLYAYEMTLEDGTTDINYAIDKNGVVAQEAFDALQFMDEDGNNVLDSNEIGGYKYNFLKAVGIIAEDATDEEAQDVMSKIRIIGFSGKCGQLIWEKVTPDTGSESTGSENTGTEDTGTENTGSESTGTEDTGTESTGTEDTGTEGTGTEDTGTETETGTESEDTGTETETGTESEDTGTETETGTESEDTGTETETGTESEDTGTEIETGTESEDTGTETETGDETDDGKTDILPGNPDDGWTVIDQPTQEETGPTTEAERTPVDEGGNGFVNDETPGSSSGLADDNFLNGGDQGGGGDTDATYDGSDTSGYDNGAQQEQGTQTVDEPSTPEEVNQVNDSEANPESAGEDKPDGEGASEAMDRLG